MANRFHLPLPLRAAFGACVLGLSLGATLAHAGDEDVKVPTAKQEAATPEDAALPEAPQAEAPVMQEEAPPPAPAFEPETSAKPSRRRGVNPNWPYDPDRNIDYKELLNSVDTEDPTSGVLQPALGFRGYRPNMIAIGAGDRTPGIGGFLEYNWNRVGMGAFYSYRKVSSADPLALAQAFVGVYGLYRWLPWDISPYFLLGGELGFHTQDGFGGLVGLGIEAQIYGGITLLAGWSYHSTVHKGFFGGSLGWSF